MQDQNTAVDKVVEAKNGDLPPELVAQMVQAEALVFIGEDQDGTLTVNATLKGGHYLPQTEKSHAFVAAIYSQHAYLLDVVNGRYNDGARFRALRDFAVLASADPARFEVVNKMLSDFENDEAVPAEGKRTAADHTRIADFLCHALAETAPAAPGEDEQARIAAAEQKRERKAEFRLLNSSGTGPLQ